MSRQSLLIGLAFLVACADTAPLLDVSLSDAGAKDARAPLSDLYLWDVEQFKGDPVVYAHTSDTLYAVDPETLLLTAIGAFVWPGEVDKMTDLALDKKGQMIGISREAVYRVDPDTADCTALGRLGEHFVGLSYVYSETADGSEFLMGIDKDRGRVFQIDPDTGVSLPIGDFGGGVLASGDVVSVKGLGTFATVLRDRNAPTDWLASIDPITGRATLIGDTGYSRIWGLGFWKDTLYGFTRDSEIVLIDINTGKGTFVKTEAGPWWGAGVTTSAPVIK